MNNVKIVEKSLSGSLQKVIRFNRWVVFLFCLIHADFNPIHRSRKKARIYGFRNIVVPGDHLDSMATPILLEGLEVPPNHAVINREGNKKFKNAAFISEEIMYERTSVEVLPKKHGFINVVVRGEAKNGGGKIIAEFIRIIVLRNIETIYETNTQKIAA